MSLYNWTTPVLWDGLDMAWSNIFLVSGNLQVLDLSKKKFKTEVQVKVRVKFIKAWDCEAKEGPLETGSVVSPGWAAPTLSFPGCKSRWDLESLGYKKQSTHQRKREHKSAQRRVYTIIPCPEMFIYFLYVGILGEVPEEDINRILDFWARLLERWCNQNEQLVGSGVILWLVSPLSYISLTPIFCNLFFYFILFLNHFYCYSIIVVSIFPPLPSSAYPIPWSHSQFPYCCPCPWVIHTCSLSSPFLFFPPVFPSPIPSGNFQSVPCFHACGSILFISLFCSLDPSYRWDYMVFVFHQMAYFT